ncbi:acyl-CoA reductase [Galbibacter mesophilus]|uniref:acyl-CoA reductase n=1 Tax=Galbibacter mesophilus TaxID=379069 RepID=UPI00191CB812|nr:acyl-CoA reductase [Galbibacter mesophilus]MCM5663360.1 acyl-CoA reductase [Galbibacter mesophilus]
MSDIHNRIRAFVKLGDFLRQFPSEKSKIEASDEIDSTFIDGFWHQIKLAEEHNSWFTKENVLFSIKNWAEALTESNLKKWLSGYLIDEVTPKKVAIIMAGNIPLVGFHDFLSTLIIGHDVLVKLSSNDKHLLPYLAKYLEVVEPSFKGKITFTEEKMTGFDAVIATGSDNTARYFEYYFGSKPNIIRKNRNSVAVLTGKESKEELEALGKDIFMYYGLGCRSVSKLFVPEGYNFDTFFEAIYSYGDIIHETKYANNYDYNKAVYLMSLFKILENGFLMLKEDEGYASPIATVFYEQYDSEEVLKNKLAEDSDKIQCVVANNFMENEVAFGRTQHPNLWDYADGVDTIKFLLGV